jgi:regulator of nucleoside diphosphate kinase
MKRKGALITTADCRRLGAWVATDEGRAWADDRSRDELTTILEKARLVEAESAPENLVTMNTCVTLADLDTGERRTHTLVYPEDCDLVPDGVSILDSLGIALIGRTLGDVVQCPDEPCGRRYRIVEILYQPERAGAWSL